MAHELSRVTPSLLGRAGLVSERTGGRHETSCKSAGTLPRMERQRHALFVGELNLSVLALERTAQGPSPVHPVHPDAVLNGIAWDANRPRNLYVTGKWWRKLYTLELGLREHVAGHTSRGAARHQRALLRLMRTLLIVAVLVMAISGLVRVLIRIRHRLADGLTISRTQNDDTSRKLTADVQATRELVARKMASH